MKYNNNSIYSAKARKCNLPGTRIALVRKDNSSRTPANRKNMARKAAGTEKRSGTLEESRYMIR